MDGDEGYAASPYVNIISVGFLKCGVGIWWDSSGKAVDCNPFEL